eukprot:scaffold51677_cov36-Phaeocystis_antarctica.AAC.1
MAEAPALPARPRPEPPCVALQSSECRAAPSRPCQYSLVPEEYRLEHGQLRARGRVWMGAPA